MPLPPVTVAGTTVNRMCASSLQSVNFAAQAVMADQMDLTIGAGVESMSRVAMGSDGGSMSPKLAERFDIIPQGLSAELIAEKWGLSREDVDKISLVSHERALDAIDNGIPEVIHETFDRLLSTVAVAHEMKGIQFETPHRAIPMQRRENLLLQIKHTVLALHVHQAKQFPKHL